MLIVRKTAILATGFAVAGLAACDFYELDTPQPVDAVGFDVAIVDVASAETARAGIYNQIQLVDNFDGYLASWQYFSDEADWTGTFPTREEFDIYSVSPANNTMTAFWAGFYEIVNAANLFIEEVEALPVEEFPEEISSSLIGEARFARAWAYFHLTQGWTDVPLVLTGTRTSGEELFVSADPRETILDQIEEDLAAAAGSIDPAQSLGITPAAAHALHARVSLYREDYAGALALAADSVIGAYDLVGTPYLEDVIWEIEYSSTDGNSLAFFYGPAALNGRYSIAPSATLVDAYEDGDIRFDLSIGILDGRPYGLKYDDFQASADAQSDPILALRYAEQFLIAAEAAYRLGDEAAALGYLNAVRERAGLDGFDDLDDETFVDVILQERFVELALESGHRLWDARRLGRAQQLFGGEYQECDDRWPFPQQEIDRNPNIQRNSACNA